MDHDHLFEDNEVGDVEDFEPFDTVTDILHTVQTYNTSEHTRLL